MNGSLVYSDTAVVSTDGSQSLNHHTSAIYFWNQNSTTSATVVLNGIYQVVIPHSPANGSHMYHCIPGDYTTFQVSTASCTLSVYAVG
jgi:hypothetical protein